MAAIRVSQTTGRFSIMQSGLTPQDASEPQDDPIMSMVNRGGMLQRLHGEGTGDDWSVRIFESRMPVVSQNAEDAFGDEPRQCHPSFGYHYIMTATHRCETLLDECKQWSNMLVAIQDRIRWLYEQTGVGYAAVFADMSKDEIPTPRIQIVTFQHEPPSIRNELRANDISSTEKGVCTICQMLDDVRAGKRLVLKTDSFVAFCPWAPSHPYELWIAPRRHIMGLLQTNQMELDDMSMMLRAALGGMVDATGCATFGIAFHFSPERKNGRQVHWHAEVYPATPPPTALEKGFGVIIGDTTPEEAAKKLSTACRNEMAKVMGVN